ncbi:MAG: hypothetical protein ABR548_02045 [Actinomycetota bacterium]|nr:hypothetical protein [Actinomycetota bacterium]
MIYLRYRIKLARRARENMKEFWSWLEKREEWFYRDLPMVKEVRWYYSMVGDVYVLENWAAFDDEAGYGAYRAALANLKSDQLWESERVTQEDWWEFLDTKLFTDLPAKVGLDRR